MPSTLKSTVTPGVSAEATVYSPATSPPTTATVIGVLIANNGDGPGTQTANVRIQRGATSVNVIKGVSIPVGDTFVPSGFEGKIVLMPGDNLRVSVNIGTVDVTASYLEQS
jgi:hypothetical protein